FYDGGGLDCAFLSFAELDARGNVNVTRFGNRADGSGGFIDISQNAKRIVFNGTLTGRGLEADIENGSLSIRQEGKFKKFINRIGQVSLDAAGAFRPGEDILFVADRAVFRVNENGLILTEIAPGIRLQEDVLDQIEFEVSVDPNLRTMDARIFTPGR